LDVPVGALLQGLEGIDRKTPQRDDPIALLSNGHAMRLARAFSEISGKRTRLALVELAEKIAAEGNKAGTHSCGHQQEIRA